MEKTKKYVLDIFAKTSRFTASPAGRTPDPAGGQAAAGTPSPPAAKRPQADPPRRFAANGCAGA